MRTDSILPSAGRLRSRTATAVVAIGASMLLSVASLHAQAGPTKILDRVRVDPRKPIDFHAAAFPETVYVGQQATYQVAVFLNADARARLRRNPEFLPPELRGLLAYELGTPTRVPPRVMSGVAYEAHVFQRAMFPVAAGALAVPAPQLSYALPQSSSYFSREERHVVRAESAQLVVRPIPTDGRPAAFTGAVGVFTVSTRLDSAAARVGDPLVFTLRVQGIGNVKLLPRPALEIDWASAVPAAERVRVDTAGPLVRGTKEFDWILTPSRDGRVEFPVLRYSYFDPYLERFADAESPAFALDVRPGVLVRSEDGESTSLLPLRTPGTGASTLRALTTSGGPVATAALALAVLAPLPALLLAVGQLRTRKRRRQPATITASRVKLEQLRVSSAAGTVVDARSLRRTLAAALADRLQVAPALLVSQRQLIRALRRRGVTRTTTERVVALLDELDATAFAAQTADVSHASARSPTRSTATRIALAADLYTAVDGEAVRGAAALPPDRLSMYTGYSAVLIALLAMIPVSSLIAQRARPRADIGVTVAQPSGGADVSAVRRDAVARASESYQRRMFTQAAELFGDLARAEPNDADALANWATASWAAGDTVSAVVGWQRATRLDPLDAGLQERLSLLPSGARGGLADVPMVPVPLLSAIAFATWLLGWLAVAMHLRGARPSTSRHVRWRTSATLLLLLAVASTGTAWWGHQLLSADRLAVVVRPETMHVAPGSDADAMGGVSTGDVVRQLQEQDGWRLVQHADGRRGWLPESRMIALLEGVTSR